MLETINIYLWRMASLRPNLSEFFESARHPDALFFSLFVFATFRFVFVTFRFCHEFTYAQSEPNPTFLLLIF